MLGRLVTIITSLFSRIKSFSDFILTSGKKANASQLYDLTHPITPETLVFPGDPTFKAEKIYSLENGSSYNLCHLHLGNHSGTHIDFPAHVVQNGKTSSDYPVSHLIGGGVIIEVPESKDQTQLGITQKFIHDQRIDKNDIVFFKTSNSKLPTNKLPENIVYLTDEGANELVKKQAKIVGIDHMSIDDLKDDKLPAHNSLLSKDILIVENLYLKNIPAGRYKEIFILPINIPEMDGLPARVFARN